MINGKFTPLDFDNGSGQAINAAVKDEEHRILGLSDQENAFSQALNFKNLKQRFYMQNIKTIESFRDSSDWTTNGTVTLTDSQTDCPIGKNTIVFYDSDAAAGYIEIYRTISSLDLTKFNDGSTSAITDPILMVLFIEDCSQFSYLSIKLGDDNTNNFSADYDPSTWTDGYTALWLAKEDFTQNGTPSGWDDITYVRITFYSTINSDGIEIHPIIFQLVRESVEYADNDDPNPFMLYDGSTWDDFFSQLLHPYSLYFDEYYDDVGLQCIHTDTDSGNEANLLIYEDIISFIASVDLRCTTDGETPSLTWYVDSDNYLELYVTSDTFTLKINEAAAGSSETETITNGILAYEPIKLYFEKDLQTVRVKILSGNNKEYFIDYETSIAATQEGSLYLGFAGSDSRGFITDINVSNSRMNELEPYKNPRLKIKLNDETVNNSNTMQNDDELFAYLPPNSFFEIEMCLIIQGANATPDFKCDWVLTNGTQKTIRYGWGPPTGVSDVLNSNTEFYAMSALTFDCPYGVDGTANESIIFEKFFISTNENGCSLQLRWAQNTAHASDTTVEAGSFLKITKCYI
ncbi:MAG: hypothetical protein ACFFDH_00515 [Promethearchaeota archaeon]